MKASRVALFIASVVVIVAGIVVALAFNSSVQTWLLERKLAQSPELHVSVGRVSAGWRHVDLTDVRYSGAGARWTAPTVALDASLVRFLFSRRLEVDKLTAEGWVLDLVPATGAPTALPATAAKPVGTTSGFSGVVSRLNLPFDLAVRAVQLRGKAVLPNQGAASNIEITGGGLGPQAPGRFHFSTEIVFAERAVRTVQLEADITVALATPRTFASCAADVKATATGARLEKPVELRGTLKATRDATVERYELAVIGPQRKLVAVDAALPAAGAQLAGTWQLDLRDADLEPFAFGQELPAFEAKGEGKVEFAADLSTAHAAGRLSGKLDRLSAVKPELKAVGALTFDAEIDVAKRAEAIAVDKVNVQLATNHPVAVVRSLQAFELNLATRDVRPTDPARELFSIVLEGLPLAWLRPLTSAVAFEGNDAHGEFVATPRASGFSFRSKSPLMLSNLSVSHHAKPLLENLELSVSANADYTPQGWQAELTGVTVRSAGRTLLLLDSKAGQLAGADQPIKATGLVSLDLKTLATQPIGREVAGPLSRGDATIEFSASLATTKQIDANVAVNNLAVAAQPENMALPSLAMKVRADLRADRTVALNVPITVARGGRTSDFTLAGEVKPTARGAQFDAQVSSGLLVLDDVRLLRALSPRPLAPKPAGEPPVQPAPRWATLNGSLGLHLKKVIYSGTFELNNVTGRLRFTSGEVKLEEVRAGVGEHGNAKIDGALRFDPAAVRPFGFGADVSLSDFDPSPLFLTANPRQPPTVEGRFSLGTRVSAHAAGVAALPANASGRFELTSKGGTFRGLPVNVGNLVENSSKLGSWLTAAGDAITSLWSRKDYDEITSRSQAANELARILSAIPYDQLSVVVTRDEALNTSIKELTLISPDIRINGSGTAHNSPGRSPLNDVVTMEYRVKARGRAAELMKFLGVLDGKPDDLGYSPCTLPFNVGGTLARVDATEVSNRLVARAVEKTGLTEKAVDWINRLRGR